MKSFIFLAVISVLVLAGCGSSSEASAHVKSSQAVAQFKPSDHMPAEAAAARKAAGY
jgi:uncharacterized protein YcfL